MKNNYKLWPVQAELSIPFLFKSISLWLGISFLLASLVSSLNLCAFLERSEFVISYINKLMLNEFIISESMWSSGLSFEKKLRCEYVLFFYPLKALAIWGLLLGVYFGSKKYQLLTENHFALRYDLFSVLCFLYASLWFYVTKGVISQDGVTSTVFGFWLAQFSSTLVLQFYLFFHVGFYFSARFIYIRSKL